MCVNPSVHLYGQSTKQNLAAYLSLLQGSKTCKNTKNDTANDFNYNDHQQEIC